jgi:hypothetical protein
MSEVAEHFVVWGDTGSTSEMADSKVERGYLANTPDISADEINWYMKQLGTVAKALRDEPILPHNPRSAATKDSSLERPMWAACGRGVLYCADDGQNTVLYSPFGDTYTVTTSTIPVFVDDEWVVCLLVSGGNLQALVFTTYDDSMYTGALTSDVLFAYAGSLVGISNYMCSCPHDTQAGAVWLDFDDSGTDRLYFYEWDGPGTSTWTATAKTAPAAIGGGAVWQILGDMAYHDGTLVLISQIDNAGTYTGKVNVSTDDGTTWSGWDTIPEWTTTTSTIQPTVVYSEGYGGWILTNCFGHVFLCTGDPSVGANWVRQTSGSPTAYIIDGGELFENTFVVGKVIGQVVIRDEADCPIFDLVVSDDMFATWRAYSGIQNCQKFGRFIAYYLYGDEVAISRGLPPLDDLAYGIPT